VLFFRDFEKVRLVRTFFSSSAMSKSNYA